MMQLQPSLLFWPYWQVSLSNEIYPYLYLSVLGAYLWNKANLHRSTFQAPGTYLVNTNAGHWLHTRCSPASSGHSHHPACSSGNICVSLSNEIYPYLCLLVLQSTSGMKEIHTEVHSRSSGLILWILMLLYASMVLPASSRCYSHCPACTSCHICECPWVIRSTNIFIYWSCSLPLGWRKSPQKYILCTWILSCEY